MDSYIGWGWQKAIMIWLSILDGFILPECIYLALPQLDSVESIAAIVTLIPCKRGRNYTYICFVL